MHSILPLIILAISPTAASQNKLAEAVEVFSCDFEQAVDVDYDKWPDHWSRRRSRDYPPYLKIEITEDPTDKRGKGKNHLRMNLDGGAAAIYSPPISVSPLFSYVMHGYIKTEKLRHDVAYYSVTFFDKNLKPLETHYSAQHRGVVDWQEVNIGPLMPGQKEIRSAVIGLHLRPSKEADITGAAMFDDIRFLRLPRMTLSTNSKHNVFSDLDNIEVTCKLSGVSQRNPTLKLELFDVRGKMIKLIERKITGRSIDVSNDGYSARKNKQKPKSDDQEQKGYIGEASWKLPIEEYGFYRVRASIEGQDVDGLHREVSLVTIREEKRPSGREFGWSLPDGEDPLSMRTLAELLGHVGINWVKYPVWFGKDDAEAADKLAEFAERLGRLDIEMVGVLDQPPEDEWELFGTKKRMLAASIFVEPELWRPIVEPVMTRLPLKVRWWQLGSDDDTSFVVLADLEEKIREIKYQLELFGQEIHLGISWRWLYQPPETKNPPWEYLSRIEGSTPFTHTELEEYLENNKSLKGMWLALRPLKRSKYDLDTRVRDLVTRMMITQTKNVDGVFIPDPFNTEGGLMNDDGTPGELLLPWRTTAFMLSDTEFVGSITLPNGSKNYIFTRGEEALMVAWASHPTQEVIYLGDDIHQIDVWGRDTIPQQEEHRQVVQVGPLPTFITGLNKSIALWRMHFFFENRRLLSIFGRDQPASFRLKNTFGQGVGGKIVMQTPDSWNISPKILPFKIPIGDELHQHFNVTLRPDVSSGTEPVRVDFEITADQNYKFSAYDTMQVGLGDVLLEITMSLEDDGTLIVKQHIVNTTEKFISFDCFLFAPDRRRQRTQVINLGQGRNTRKYIYRDGEQLIGKTLWLRAEEINGPRILNHRVKIEP